ncbi:sensor histidine kinase [Sunxiuqinia elliptica]|uniref:histidine kinase n=1 Tax=Sunxiuqinia elliptica TaxID=655355 RepID=A0A4R6H0C3_9BACT|nr:ATP-binding protein [Sunxiuqinia elliptica]TDO01234.1 two-component system phosphate regulon sensor histidine kinase PhoR [Sunxiuqinia elliptica]TDO57745.1 two-component system phosphate regulon sensor histidine kinase PhoR [Sunxiuqinia elliptica]
MKTYSPRKLALYLSLTLTFFAALLVIVLSFISFSGWLYLLLSLLYFGFTYLAIAFIMRRYVDYKVEPIYKIIRKMPVQGKEIKRREDSSDLISSARLEVEEWAKNQTQEITRLKDLERYRKEFVGNVSHELKTPIFNIQGYILTLLEGGIDDPKVNKLYLKRTEKSIDRMISIVEDLESITKLESGELKLKYESFDLVRLVDDVIEMEQMMASERKIQLQFNRPEKPVKVLADKKRIMEVMTNLVVNGIKYGKRKGFVKISFYDLKDNLMVEVADNGLGIDSKHLARIFERFYRADKSRSREQGGTGLGLSIVKHIIEAHEQTINVKSAVDEGTTFTFTLEKAK